MPVAYFHPLKTIRRALDLEDIGGDIGVGGDMGGNTGRGGGKGLGGAAARVCKGVCCVTVWTTCSRACNNLA